MTSSEKVIKIFSYGSTMLNDVLVWIGINRPQTIIHFNNENKFFIGGHEWDLSHSYLMAQSDSFIDFLYTVYLQNQ